MKRSWLPALLLRFGILYAVLLFASFQLPLFAWFEQGAVRLAGFALQESGEPAQVRSLALVEKEDDWYYRFEFRVGEQQELLERRYHPHAYVLLLFGCLVLATPGLTLKQRLTSLTVGGLLVFALGVGLLLSDLDRWERAAQLAANANPPRSSFGAPLGWLAALHRTSGAALIPLVLWLMVVAGRFAVDREPARDAEICE